MFDFEEFWPKSPIFAWGQTRAILMKFIYLEYIMNKVLLIKL